MCAMADGLISKKRSFEPGFKLKVVECAEKESNGTAARKFGVDEKRVREWRKKKRELGQLSSKKKRLEGAGRKSCYQKPKRNWKNGLSILELQIFKSPCQVCIQRKAKELF